MVDYFVSLLLFFLQQIKWEMPILFKSNVYVAQYRPIQYWFNCSSFFLENVSIIIFSVSSSCSAGRQFSNYRMLKYCEFRIYKSLMWLRPDVWEIWYHFLKLVSSIFCINKQEKREGKYCHMMPEVFLDQVERLFL